MLHDLRRQRDFNYRSVQQHLHIHDGLRLNGTGIPLKLKCEGEMQRVRACGGFRDNQILVIENISLTLWCEIPMGV